MFNRSLLEELSIFGRRIEDSDKTASMSLNVSAVEVSIILRNQNSPMCISSVKSSMHLYRGPSINKMQRRGL